MLCGYYFRNLSKAKKNIALQKFFLFKDKNQWRENFVCASIFAHPQKKLVTLKKR